MDIGLKHQQDNSYLFEAKNWQIAMSTSGVEDEDIPDEIMARLIGIKYLTTITLEPISAPKAAHVILRKICKSISKNAIGIIEDQQIDSLILPPGAKKYTAPVREKSDRFTLLEFSWWFENDLMRTREGLAHFLHLLERYLPEALPRRYGLYEPPSFKYVEMGSAHFIEQCLEQIDRGGLVCYPTRPVTGLHFAINAKSGFVNIGGQRRYKSSCIRISLDAAVLDLPDWRNRIIKVWEELSLAIQPFFGDVRLLKNFIYAKNTFYVDRQTENHPIKSWWWKGLPDQLGQAFVIGNPYVDLWPDIKSRGLRRGSLYFLSTKDWRDMEDASGIIGKTPESLVEISNDERTPYQSPLSQRAYQYPSQFPFIDYEK